MGRFDALTQLDNKPVHQSPAPLREAVQQPEIPINGKPESQKAGNPETLKHRKPDPLPFLKAEKYSTQLEPTMIKHIKQYALEHDLKDYEVVQAAIKDYFARNK